MTVCGAEAAGCRSVKNPEGGAKLVDVPAGGRCRADEQRGGARLEALGVVAAQELRDTERGGQSVRRAGAGGGDHTQAAGARRAGVSGAGLRFSRAGIIDPGGPNAFGTLSIQRRFKNTLGVSVTRLRFRVVDITTINNRPAGFADLRVLSSTGVVKNSAGTTIVTVTGLTLEGPAHPHIWKSGNYHSLNTGFYNSSQTICHNGTINFHSLYKGRLVEKPKVAGAQAFPTEALDTPILALLGVVTELTGRYSPERLAVSADRARVGLSGWIIGRVLGRETDIDEEPARLGIAELIERGLVTLNAARRLEATASGARLWQGLGVSLKF